MRFRALFISFEREISWNETESSGLRPKIKSKICFQAQFFGPIWPRRSNKAVYKLNLSPLIFLQTNIAWICPLDDSKSFKILHYRIVRGSVNMINAGLTQTQQNSFHSWLFQNFKFVKISWNSTGDETLFRSRFQIVSVISKVLFDHFSTAIR